MAIYRTRAVVLKSMDLGESDKIITILSRDRGKLRMVARGVRRFRSRLVGGTLPFCYSDFLVYEGRTLDSVSQCEIIESFMPLREDLVKMAYASYIAELTSEFLPEGDANEKTFLLILKTYRLMSKCFNPETMTKVFELRLLSFLGYNPELERCVCCGGEVTGNQINLSPKQGGIVCGRCRLTAIDSMQVNKQTVATLKTLTNISTGELKLLKIPSWTMAELSEVLRQFIIYYLGKQLKSLKFLDTVFQLKNQRGDNSGCQFGES